MGKAHHRGLTTHFLKAPRIKGFLPDIRLLVRGTAKWRSSRHAGRGFTLLELLVVVGVIGILISMATIAYSTAQKKMRDNTRKSHLKDIQKAFEQYYVDNSGKYPADAACSVNLLITPYISSGMPKDPATQISYATVNGAVCTSAGYCFCTILETEDGNALKDCANTVGKYYCVRQLQ